MSYGRSMSDGDGEARLRVMVVDDHPMWRDAVERDLQDAGYDVVAVAADGHQAMARFRVLIRLFFTYSVK